MHEHPSKKSILKCVGPKQPYLCEASLLQPAATGHTPSPLIGNGCGGAVKAADRERVSKKEG